MGQPSLSRRRCQHPDRCTKLDDRQRERLTELLAQVPAAYGFGGEVWTRSRVVQVIEQEFGVSYDPSQVGRILWGCGWSHQKPALRSAQRDEVAIGEWRERRFAELKKRPSRRPHHPCIKCGAGSATRLAAYLGPDSSDPGNPTQVELRSPQRN